ncbi:hypothetical protein BDY19DRAFT_1075426 [Irpex rosettiformis]|uniref:Uncharacterized protein n=1 Tax=Irpex rosettiformis TaxID=378272 RepID=A0ACB8TVC5_9APHY|nr:hypothetical protein BDY19DRAFT_1075426 [Irpex rosettiformis]
MEVDGPNEPVTNTSASELVDVKPQIRPFPLKAPDESMSCTTPRPKQELQTTSTKSANLPSPLVKREPSPISKTLLSSRKAAPASPIYISSGSEDSDEVDAQMDMSQSKSETHDHSEAGHDPHEEQEQDELDEDMEGSESNPADERSPVGERSPADESSLSDESSESKPDEDVSDAQNTEDMEGVENTAETDHEPQGSPRKSPSRERSPSTPSSSSLPSTLPGIPKAKRRPQPRAISSSQPPSEAKKRLLPPNLPSATQPVASSSSRRSQSRASTLAHSKTPVNNTGDIVLCDSEEDDKRYAKRQKTHSAGPSHGKARKSRTRHPRYWFLDGSVVVQLEDIMFRLHRSRLASQSTYFQELFSSDLGALGEDPFDFVEQYPVYPVKGVSVTDFEELLVALDNAISYVYEPPTFPQLAAILRASQTLRFTALEDFASRTLLKMWPQALSKLSASHIPHASETVLLARKCDMPSILKRAFYELLRTTRLGEDEDADPEDPDVINTQISRQDLARLIKAREELVSRWIVTAGSPPDITCNPDPNSNSANHPPDKAKLLNDWQQHVKRNLFEECLYDPLVGLRRLGEINWEGMGYCHNCVKLWRDLWTAQGEKLWQQLDLWLGLPTNEEE